MMTIVSIKTLDRILSDWAMTFHTLGTACLMESMNPSWVTMALTSSAFTFSWMNSSIMLGMLLMNSSCDT